jgi:Protein of unknown function (DUF2795)
VSIASKKKDKVDSGGEASANYMIGKGSEVGRSETEGAGTTANKITNTNTNSQEGVTTQKEKVISTSSSLPQHNQTPAEPRVTTTGATTNEVPQYQYQQQHQRQQQTEQQQSLKRALDETKDNIRRSLDEARREIPRYTQTANEYQEQTIQAAREIADNYIESQKEIINSLQSAWLPQIETMNKAFTSAWMSPRHFTQAYANMVSNFADNIIAASRLASNMVFSNIEAFRITIQQTRDNTKELSRISVNTARSLEQTTRDAANSYAPSSAFAFNEEQQQQQQIPSRQNKEETQNVMEAQNHIAGQRRQQTVADLPRAAAVGQALKNLRFPADKRKIQLFVQQQSNNNPDYQKIVSLLDKIEDRQYQNVSDVTKAAGIVE